MHDGVEDGHNDRAEVHWSSTSGPTAATLDRPDGEHATSGPQWRLRRRMDAVWALLEVSDHQTVAGIALYALCTLCSSGQ